MKTVSMKIALPSAFLVPALVVPALVVMATASAASAQQQGGVPIPPPPRASAPVLPPVGQPVAQPDETAVSLPAPPPVTAAAPAGTIPSPVVTVVPGAQTSGSQTSGGQASAAQTRPRAPGSPQVTLQIELETQQEGRISVSIYQDAESFRRGQTPLRTLMVERNGPVTRAWVLGVAPGRYAIAAWQDVDGDGVQRKGALGLGGEPLGYSNNVRSRFGPPSFDQAAFDLPATGVTERIRLR